jgi:hypothetical protein
MPDPKKKTKAPKKGAIQARGRDLSKPLSSTYGDDKPKKQKMAEKGILKTYPLSNKSDSASWARKKIPTLTGQGLSSEINKLSKITNPNYNNVINSKIRMLKKEQKRRQPKK